MVSGLPRFGGYFCILFAIVPERGRPLGHLVVSLLGLKGSYSGIFVQRVLGAILVGLGLEVEGREDWEICGT